MKSIVIVSLLICTLFAFASADESSSQESNNIELDVFQGSNAWWIAIAVQNGGVDTSSVQIKDSKSSSSWNSMDYTDGWGYWTCTSQTGQFEFPLSIRLTAENGEQVTINNAVSSASVGTVDTGVQYGSSSSPTAAATASPTAAATASPTAAPDTHTTAPVSKHTKAPTTAPTAEPTAASKHTKAPTTAPTAEPTAAPTAEPTAAPTAEHTAAPTAEHTTAPTAAHTTAPTAEHTTAPTAEHTTAPTSTRTTAAPTTTSTKAATTKPTSGSSTGCSGPLKLLVPLYVDPGSAWDTVAASGSIVPTVAIINPDSGPGTGPDSSYTTYMAQLQAAGVEMIGYVHTSYGARAIADVQADIDVYATEFPLLVGIFVDETSTDASEVAYYQQLYTYIMSFPGWKYDILNPGAVPAAGYAAVATQIVTYEDTASGFPSSQDPSGVSCSDKNEYAVITYSASSTSSMESVVNAAVSKGYYGWVYATDGTAGGNTYGSVPSYYSAMASYIASVN